MTITNLLACPTVARISINQSQSDKITGNVCSNTFMPHGGNWPSFSVLSVQSFVIVINDS